MTSEGKQGGARESVTEVNPITGMSGRQMQANYWWVTHQVILRKIGLGILVAIDALLLLYSLYAWGTYAFYGYWKERAMLRDMAVAHIPFKQYRERHKPAELAPGEVALFDSGTKAGWKDMIAPIENPNERWIASVTYHFEDGENITPEETAVVLPGAATYLGVLGYIASTTVSAPELVISATEWKTASARRVPDPALYMEQRLDFNVGEPVIVKPGTGKEDVKGYQIAFDITNATAYSYWSVPLWILLYHNSTQVGIEQAVLEPFLAGETKKVDVRSLLTNRSINKVEVIPRLNVFDEGVYRPLE